jgi:chemotaxis protein CheD
MIEKRTVVKVGIADLNTVSEPDIIRTLGLGSCVGIVIYDEFKKVAGLSHILLPNSKGAKQRPLNIYKYADTAIPHLVERLIALGARKYALKSKIAGGAEMFSISSGNELLRIGPRNVEAAVEQLRKLNIPIIAKDTGGNVGRTIEFSPTTSELMVKKINQEPFIM